jgi:hypothetical protein
MESIGTLLYYARAAKFTLLFAFGTLVSVQAHGIEATAQTVIHLLN